MADKMAKTDKNIYMIILKLATLSINRGKTAKNGSKMAEKVNELKAFLMRNTALLKV